MDKKEEQRIEKLNREDKTDKKNDPNRNNYKKDMVVDNYIDVVPNIAFIGNGHVNKAMRRYFERKYYHAIYDKYSSVFGNDKQYCNNAKFGIVAVPTNAKKDGSCDLSEMDEVMKWLNTEIIIIKSTVPPGTTLDYQDKYPDKRIVFSPEYYGESKYYIPSEMNDIWEWPYHIFGGDEKDTKECVELFMSVLGPTKKYYQTDSNTAEMVKYMENTYFATKVTFCQEMYDLCKACGIDYNKVRELFVADPRVNEMHTAVFPDKRGFSGKCFPKDISAIVKFAKEYFNIDMSLLKQVIKTNETIKRKRIKS